MKKKTLTPLPKSMATNMYELFRDVKRAIRDEPLRVNMGFYMRRYTASQCQLSGAMDYKIPSCGAVGVFGGMGCNLVGVYN